MKEFSCENNPVRLAKPYVVDDREDSAFTGTYFGVFCFSKYQSLLLKTLK